jgi:hypothetical protein
MANSAAVRRYSQRVMVLMFLYAASLMAVVYSFSRHLLTGPPAYVAAVLPALPIIGIFVAMGRYLIDESDEYLRMLMIRQSLIASGFMLSIVTAWGFLEGFGLVPHIVSYYAAVLWFAGMWVGLGYNIVVTRRSA